MNHRCKCNLQAFGVKVGLISREQKHGNLTALFKVVETSWERGSVASSPGGLKSYFDLKSDARGEVFAKKESFLLVTLSLPSHCSQKTILLILTKAVQKRLRHSASRNRSEGLVQGGRAWGAAVCAPLAGTSVAWPQVLSPLARWVHSDAVTPRPWREPSGP